MEPRLFLLGPFLSRALIQAPAIPKKDTIFRVEIPFPNSAEERVDAIDGDADPPRPRNLVFELHGNQFEFRPADRANRKFKWKTMDYL
jgi:ribonuclease P protein subunit POP4